MTVRRAATLTSLSSVPEGSGGPSPWGSVEHRLVATSRQARFAEFLAPAEANGPIALVAAARSYGPRYGGRALPHGPFSNGPESGAWWPELTRETALARP